MQENLFWRDRRKGKKDKGKDVAGGGSGQEEDVVLSMGKGDEGQRTNKMFLDIDSEFGLSSSDFNQRARWMTVYFYNGC